MIQNPRDFLRQSSRRAREERRRSPLITLLRRRRGRRRGLSRVLTSQLWRSQVSKRTNLFFSPSELFASSKTLVTVGGN